MRHFPDFIEAYLTLTSSQEASTKMHRWTAISMLAGALERKVWLYRGHYVLYPNLYIAIVAPSGYKKSTATGFGVNFLRDLPTLKIMADRLTATALVDNLHRSQKEFDYKGAGFKQSACFLYTSEFLAFMKDAYGPVSEFLTTFYDCVPHDSTQPWIYETKGDGQKKIYGPCLNILAASTATWLAEAIPASQMEGGFASRILFVVENEPPARFVPFPEDEQRVSETYKLQLGSDLAQIHSLVGAVQITPTAKEWYRPWYEAHMRRSHATTDLRFTGYNARKPDLLLKLGIVCSVSQGNSLVVDQPHLERAISLLECIELTMFEAFAHSGRNPYSKDTTVISKWFLDRWSEDPTQAIDHSEVLRHNLQHITSASLTLIMNDLLGSGYIRAEMRMARMHYLLTPLGQAELHRLFQPVPEERAEAPSALEAPVAAAEVSPAPPAAPEGPAPLATTPPVASGG